MLIQVQMKSINKLLISVVLSFIKVKMEIFKHRILPFHFWQ